MNNGSNVDLRVFGGG